MGANVDEERIREQKFQIRVLTSLYLKFVLSLALQSLAPTFFYFSSHDLGRSDTLDGMGGPQRPGNKRQVTDPTLLAKKALHGFKRFVPFLLFTHQSLTV